MGMVVTKLGLVGDQDEVAGEGELEAAGAGNAVNNGNHRNFEPLQA